MRDDAPPAPRRTAKPVSSRQARPEKLAAFRVGISAESRAAAWLIAHGYRILSRRWKCPLGEIDIVAARRHLLIFVEVKARATLDAAAESVTPRQRRRIAQAAELWLAHFRSRRSAICALTPSWSRPANCHGTFRRLLKTRDRTAQALRRSKNWSTCERIRPAT